jgi:D-3-phosphoglycerate dehydrogenase
VPNALGEDDLIAALRRRRRAGHPIEHPGHPARARGRPRLRAVGAFCIGTNQIALDDATKRGVAVFNAPYSNTRSVVELAIAEIIALARHLTDHNAKHARG